MFTASWKTSERQYGITAERHVKVPVGQNVLLVGDIFRPDAPGRFPVILGCHPYNNELQTAPLRPIGHGNLRGFIEAGDPAFYVRRGYVQAVFNVRGTGRSQGEYPMMASPEAEDVCDLIQWLADQPWSNGNVAMFGVSYFAWLQKKVASLNPPALKAIFAPYGATDFYRDVFYRGGILSHRFLEHWVHHWDNPRPVSWSREHLDDQAYRAAIAEALDDEEILAIPALREALLHPDDGRNPAVVDVVLNRLDGPYWHDRNVNAAAARVPAMLGGCWGIYGLHLPGAFRSWPLWQGPKKMIVGPPLYLDRPLYQYQYESLRWFDFWLKGMDTKVLDDPPVRLFIPPTGEWRTAEDWPLPETRWIPFYLHERRVLSEHEMWPGEGCSTFEDSPFLHEGLVFWTPPLVENTEIMGPVVASLHLSTTDTDALLFAALLVQDEQGRQQELTRGWLRASQRRLREDSSPAEPVLAHTAREPLCPNEIYELRFPLVATGRLVRAGERIGLQLRAADDDEPANRLEALARGCIWRQNAARITIHHSEDYPSHLLLPITRGNIVGTYLSGGHLPQRESGVLPTAKIDRPKDVPIRVGTGQ